MPQDAPNGLSIDPQALHVPLPLGESMQKTPVHHSSPLALLKKHVQAAPSAVLHIHPTHFRFDQQDGVFLLSSPMRFFLEFVRDGQIPADLVDVFHEANLPYYE
ncbi:hypothetical protein IWQ62_006547, partial [Dispira parvispora]